MFRDKFRKVCEDTFGELVAASGIDINANRALCAQIDDLSEQCADTGSKITWMTVVCVVLWLVVAAGVFAAFAFEPKRELLSNSKAPFARAADALGDL